MTNNRDDFDFDDDPFGRDDDFNNNFDQLDDDDAGLNTLDDDFGDDDDLLADENAEEQRGPNRTFLIIAVALIVIFVLLICGAVVLLTRPQQDTTIDQTRTAIAVINSTRLAEITITQQAQTAQAIIALTETARPTNTFTPSPSPTETPSPTVGVTETPTISEADLTGTQQVLSFQATLTAQAEPLETDDPGQPVGGSTISIGAVQQTATALALTLNPVTGTPDASVPLPTTGVTPGFNMPNNNQNELPNTGLFDGFAGSDGLGTAALMALGLIGLIVISRSLRRRV